MSIAADAHSDSSACSHNYIFVSQPVLVFVNTHAPVCPLPLQAAIPAIMAAAPVRAVKSKEERKAEMEKAKAEQAAAAAAAEKAKLAKAAA